MYGHIPIYASYMAVLWHLVTLINQTFVNDNR